MKKLVDLLIGIAAISVVLALISRLSIKPILGIASRGMVGFAAVLLLLAIALSVKK